MSCLDVFEDILAVDLIAKAEIITDDKNTGERIIKDSAYEYKKIIESYVPSSDMKIKGTVTK